MNTTVSRDVDNNAISYAKAFRNDLLEVHSARGTLGVQEDVS
jgi:hypothetical protein